MSISSNSLFHYTSNFKILKSIIRDGFYLSYCQERNAAYPMVSFCDLPLSKAKYYFDNYGKYCIGMSQSWAKKNGLNPVLYIDEDSYIIKSYTKGVENILNQHFKFKSDISISMRDSIIALFNLDRFYKPYQGELIRKNGKRVSNYKFYDEREWRYIPDINIKGFTHRIKTKQFKDYKSKNSKPHIKSHSLNIKANDINYIIVNNENEIPILIDYLLQTKNLGNKKELAILTTRIITSKKIIEDF